MLGILGFPALASLGDCCCSPGQSWELLRGWSLPSTACSPSECDLPLVSAGITLLIYGSSCLFSCPNCAPEVPPTWQLPFINALSRGPGHSSTEGLGQRWMWCCAGTVPGHVWCQVIIGFGTDRQLKSLGTAVSPVICDIPITGKDTAVL